MFRWTLAVSGAFIACMLLMFGFILAQAHSYMTADVDALVSEIANTIASHEPQQRILGLDQYLRAFDLGSGKELWKARLPAGAQATPMTYMAKGRQYVVVTSGGHSIMGTKNGDYTIAYALPRH